MNQQIRSPFLATFLAVSVAAVCAIGLASPASAASIQIADPEAIAGLALGPASPSGP